MSIWTFTESLLHIDKTFACQSTSSSRPPSLSFFLTQTHNNYPMIRSPIQITTASIRFFFRHTFPLYIDFHFLIESWQNVFDCTRLAHVASLIFILYSFAQGFALFIFSSTSSSYSTSSSSIALKMIYIDQNLILKCSLHSVGRFGVVCTWYWVWMSRMIEALNALML